MAEVLLFHHAHGLTTGVREFADELIGAGHVVHTPDLYDGNTFAELSAGVGYAKQVGFDAIMQRGERAADGLPHEIVYAGFSLGVMPAQKLAQTRAHAKAAMFFSACLPMSEFGPWPEGVTAQIHIMEDDEWAQEGDIDAAREIAREVEGAELFLYPGGRHLFADRSLRDYDAEAARLLTKRTLDFLATL